MEMSDSVDEIIPELHTVWSKLDNPPRNETVQTEKFSYDYTTLDELIDHVKPLCDDHDLTVVQTTEPIDGRPHVITTLFHDSGQWVKSKTPIMCKAEDPQDFGAGMTYARRYSLSAILGIASESDEDGRTRSRSNSGGSSSGGSSGGGGITEKQVNKIYAEMNERFDPDRDLSSPDEFKAFIYKNKDVESLNELTKNEGSDVIDWLMSLPKEDDVDDGGENPL